MGKKYDALGQFLKTHASDSTVPLTFAEIEAIIGSKLPPSAYEYRPWWSNNPSNNVMTKVWLAAGFKTEQVDVAGEKLVFSNEAKMAREFDDDPNAQRIVADAVKDFQEVPREFRGSEVKPLRRHPLIGAMKGTFTIEPGWDLTKPMMDDDEIAEWEANLDRTADMIEAGMNGNKK